MNVTFLATLERASHEFVRVVLNKFFWGDSLWQTYSQPCMPVTILRVQTEKTAWLVVDWAKIFRAGWRRFCFLSEMIVQRKIWMKIGRLGTFGPLQVLHQEGCKLSTFWGTETPRSNILTPLKNYLLIASSTTFEERNRHIIWKYLIYRRECRIP